MCKVNNKIIKMILNWLKRIFGITPSLSDKDDGCTVLLSNLYEELDARKKQLKKKKNE